jgi:hypothetical protein
MVNDPYFSPGPIPKAVLSRRGRWIRRIVLVPLLLVSGCHMLMTGWPIPLWHIERLHNPFAVAAIGDEALVLADERRVRLPFIKKLPKHDPVFARALVHGVEVDAKGEVFGLIDPPRMCGNDPTWFYRQRANLSDLAGLLTPAGIDDSVVHPEAIADLKEHIFRTPDRHGMPYFVMGQMARVRRTFETAKRRSEAGEVDIRSDSLD